MVAQCVCVRVGWVFSEWVGILGILYYYIFIIKFNYINCLWHPIAVCPCSNSSAMEALFCVQEALQICKQRCSSRQVQENPNENAKAWL